MELKHSLAGKHIFRFLDIAEQFLERPAPHKQADSIKRFYKE